MMLERTLLTLALTVPLSLAIGCGGDAGGDGSGDGSGDGVDGGDSGETGDGVSPECSDGVDNDGDGLTDGADPHCTGPEDDLEDSFATGIPGDNIDAIKQDCFFDGNSGQGDDGCDIHVCCLLDDCPPEYQGSFNENSCDQSQKCLDNCGAITPPGCDCFGCCTVCDGEECYDVYTNPATAPECDVDVLDDPDKCPPCTMHDSCGDDGCDNEECELCPGQLPEDLPEHCMGDNVCDGGATPCESDDDCTGDSYCNTGCCVAVIQ